MCNIDTLYVEGHRVVKIVLADADSPESLVPRLGVHLSLGMSVASAQGVARPPTFWARSRTGHQRSVSREKFDLLCAVDGTSSVEMIAKACGRERRDVVADFVDLQSLGLVCIEMPLP